MWTDFSFWHWLLIAVILLILELLSGSGFLLWTAVSAIITGIFAAILGSTDWQLQGYLFCGLTVVSALAWWYYFKHDRKQESNHLNQRAQQYVGEAFTLIEPIKNGRGKIDVYGVPWVVQGEDSPVGTSVKVIAAHGLILQVVTKKDEI